MEKSLSSDNEGKTDSRRVFSDKEIQALVKCIHAGAVIKDPDEKAAVMGYFVKTGRTMGLTVDEFGVYTGKISDKTVIQNPAGPVRILAGKTPPTHPFAFRVPKIRQY